MAKSPQAGRVKTRLACALGDTQAVRFYRTSLRHTLIRLGRDPRWRTVLAITPDRAPCPPWTHAASSGFALMAQGNGGLGVRMQRLFRRAPPGPAIIVGADIPGICPDAVARAFRLLGSSDAVFGPAEDGGYWLVGLKRRPRLPSPFAGVRWSSAHALTDTLVNLEGQKVGLAERLRDVDCADDFRAVGDSWQRLILRRGKTAASKG